MSDTAETRHVYCKFGLVNLAGLIPMENKEKNNIPISAEIKIPLFSHESYKIKTTLSTNLKFFGTSQTWSSDFAKIWFSDVKDQNDSNFGTSDDPNHGKYYQKKFRRNVLWDFGDGTQIEGYQAEHAYTKPGRYKISCTFFDINRKGWVNDFSLYVIVKEVIPTYLRFDKTFTKTEIKCSKIERIARIESLVSNTVDKELNVGIRRVFSDDENTSNYEEIGHSYNDISKKDFFHMEQYWCALQNKQTLFYNSDQVYLSELTPTDVYRPQYNKLYCKFYYDEANKESAPIGLSFYQVIPYKNIDENLKTITVVNPYTIILDGEERKTYQITQVYTEDQLPEGVSYCGMRGWVDIFYRNDYIGNPNTLSIYHDIENENITGELQSSNNYLNINPLGLTFNVIPNIKDDIRMGLSANGFLKPVEEGAKLSDSDRFIDQHLRNALYKGIDLNCYIIPYVTYDNSSFKIMDDAYYVPKDVVLNLSYSYQTDEKYGKPSEVNQGGNNESSHRPIYPWMYCVPFILYNYIDITLNVTTNKDKNFSLRLTKKPLQNPKSVKIPREKTATVDVDRLLDVYMVHPMFKGKENLRSLMKSYVNSFVENMITEGINFLDNTANIRTCYLSNLLSILKMMGEDVTEFEYTSLGGVNDLKKFARILSINHADLVGHVIGCDYEININKDNKGINVGDLIGLDDVLYLTNSKPADNKPREQDNYGKIIKVKKDSDFNVNVPGGVDLIIHDRYTNATKIVNFRKYLELTGKDSVSIGDYDSSWGWNLLLPDGYQKIGEKIKEYQNKEKNKGYDSQQKEFFRREITRLKLVRKELIEGYYDFYLLNPNKDDIRVGNFLRNEDIIPEIQSSEEWDKLWGITHDILMKIIIENAGLSNGRDGGDDYNGDDSWDATYINLKQALNLGANTTIQPSNTSVIGQVYLRGEIMGEGKNSLYIEINGGYIDYVNEFDISSNFFECEVSGKTISGSGLYDVIGEFVSGTMEVTLSGSLQNPVLGINTNLIYNPTV